MRNQFMVVLVVGGVCATAIGAPKNVLLMIGDDHGLELGCYGNRVIRTRNLDKLASEGVRFENAFCTTASCSPSRSVIFTGMHNHANGQYGLAHSPHNFQMKPGVRTVVQRLKESGYKTGMIGKLHVEPADRFPFDFQPRVNARDVTRISELAEEFLGQSTGSPFFLAIGFIDPHRDFGNRSNYPGVEEIRYSPTDVIVPKHLPDIPEAREELAEYYQSVSRLDQGVGKVLAALEASGRANETLVIYMSDNGMPFPGAKTTVYEPGVHLPLLIRAPGVSKAGLVSKAMVSWVDVTPTILDWAEGERGSGRGGDGGKDKRAARGKQAGRELDTSKSSAAMMHGRSLLTILGEADPKGWDEVYCSHSFHEVTMSYPMRVVRTRTHKLIWNPRPEVPFPFASDLYGSKTWQAVLSRDIQQYGSRPTVKYVYRSTFELYDLVSDPEEAKNLADDPTSAEVKRDLQGKLVSFLRATNDPWLELVEQKQVGRPE